MATIDHFVRGHGCPVKRAQIAGLLQIVANEPGRLADFAASQRGRAEKRAASTTRFERKAEHENEVEFWKLIHELCSADAKKRPWSLKQARDAVPLPADCVPMTFPPGAKVTKEQDAERKDRRGASRRGRGSGTATTTAAFFRHFCADYLYRMPPGKE